MTILQFPAQTARPFVAHAFLLPAPANADVPIVAAHLDHRRVAPGVVELLEEEDLTRFVQGFGLVLAVQALVAILDQNGADGHEIRLYLNLQRRPFMEYRFGDGLPTLDLGALSA